MLRKLLKYDLIGVYKFLIIFYCLALFFSLLTRIFLSIDKTHLFYKAEKSAHAANAT